MTVPVVKMPPVTRRFITMTGGADLVSPPLTLKEGALIDAQNFEADSLGGYRRIKGYERYDGQASPNEASYDETATDPVGIEATLLLRAGLKKAAADAARALITAVPGSGAIRGVWIYNGTVYAFRDDNDASECCMYKATGSGWSKVTLGVTLVPGGTYRFVNYNFGGGATTAKMYGCDGKNKGFSFDGTTFTQITTGMSTDTPNYVAAHSNHLFFAFGASMQHSGINDPNTWTVVSGAGELAMGDTITSMLPIMGGTSGAAMMVTTRHQCYMLYGTSSADWKLVLLQNETGAVADTARNIGTPFMLNDRGITQLQQTQAYGNFQQATLTHAVRPFLMSRLSKVAGACVNRERNQYRLFFTDGSAMYVTLAGVDLVGAMPMLFDVTVSCVVSAEDSAGNERTFFGATNGYVYELDVGPSFDGNTVRAYIKTGYMHMGSPRIRKQFRRAAIDANGEAYAGFQLFSEYDYGAVETAMSATQDVAQAFSAGRWDDIAWDSFFWDGKTVQPATVDCYGSGENISLTLYSASALYESFVITGAILQYTPRRSMR